MSMKQDKELKKMINKVDVKKYIEVDGEALSFKIIDFLDDYNTMKFKLPRHVKKEDGTIKLVSNPEVYYKLEGEEILKEFIMCFFELQSPEDVENHFESNNSYLLLKKYCYDNNFKVADINNLYYLIPEDE